MLCVFRKLFISYSGVQKGCILGLCFGYNYCRKGEAFRRDAFGSLLCGRSTLCYVIAMFRRVRNAAC